MSKVFNDACDKNVAVNIVYANASNKLFYTETMTGDSAVPVEADDCLNLFLKGVVAIKNGNYYAAKSCSSAGVIDFGFPA